MMVNAMENLKKDKRKKDSFRHELKYYISFADYLLLSKKLSATMLPDENANEYGEYRIRSLYFDDMANSALSEKLFGVGSRDKIRIRIYNGSDKLIKLERKHKEGGLICKKSISLTKGEYERLLSGKYGFLLARDEPFAREMFATFSTFRLRPVVIVDYTREAYTFPMQDVRITFDKDVRTAYHSADIFDRNLITYPAIDGNDIVLEIKYNRYLPKYVQTLIQSTTTRSAVSKYVISRKYEL